MTLETPNRQKMIELLNEDLSREYQAVIAYTVYSQVLKGAKYMSVAKELESHAKEELGHALKISKQIDYLGGQPTGTAKPVKLSDKAEELPHPRPAGRCDGRIRAQRSAARNPG